MSLPVKSHKLQVSSGRSQIHKRTASANANGRNLRQFLQTTVDTYKRTANTTNLTFAQSNGTGATITPLSQVSQMHHTREQYLN